MCLTAIVTCFIAVQLRNTHCGVAQTENSKNGIVGGNAEFVWSCCFMFGWTVSYSTQWPAWLNQSLFALFAGHITPKSLYFWPYLYFILKAYTDWISCLGMVQQGGLFPPTCPTEKQYKSHEHNLKQMKFHQRERKQLLWKQILWGLNAGRGCPEWLWSLYPLSKLKLNGTRCRATCSNWVWPG